MNCDKTSNTTKAAKKLENLPELGKLCIKLINGMQTGLVLCGNGIDDVIYMNDLARKILDIADAEELLFSDEDRSKLLANVEIMKYINGVPTKIYTVAYKDYIWIILSDQSDFEKMKILSNRYLELNKEFISVFTQYGDETILITDNKGIIEFAGEEISNNCGVPRDFFIGKSVFDMEKQRLFYPSVCVKVLQSGKTEVIIQKTNNNFELVSMGTPIMNNKGCIEKVISITRDYRNQIKISTMIADTKTGGRLEATETNDRIITCDENMMYIKTTINLIAPTNSTVLINGETGTGKEVIARAIYEKSKRVGKPFVKVNCGSISSSLVESELFGYEAGSFTGAKKEGKIGLIESANGGTLFLDEVSELPMEQQVKLLHVLQERMLIRVGGTSQIGLDIRVIAASNKDLEQQVHLGKFREDLYYRLNVVPINLPALRERTNDIPLLIKHFLTAFCGAYGKEKQISKRAKEMMCGYPWPGNIRELENTIERLVVTTAGCLVEDDALPEKIREFTGGGSGNVVVNNIVPLEEAIEDTEKKLISMALKKHKTTVKVAEVLGVNQSTISRKMSQYNIKINSEVK